MAFLLSVSDVTATQATLAWTDPYGGTWGGNYDIVRNGAVVHTNGSNEEHWGDDGLAPGTSYYYWINAMSGPTIVFQSNTVNFSTPSAPYAPGSLAAQAVSTSQINLNWQDNSSDELDFHIEESADGSTGWAETSPATVAANITIYNRTGLASDTLKYYRVRAHNASGYSGYSNVASARTWAAVAQPTNLTAIAYSGTEVDIAFQDNSSAEDDHRLERKTGVGAFAEVKTFSANVTGGRDTGLAAGTTYVYRIRAKQGASYSAYSDEVTVTTLAVPGAPSGLALSEVQDTTIRLTWTAPSTGGAVVGYKIESSPDDATWTEIAKIYTQVCSYLATGLAASTLVYFRVRAFNAAGNSASYCASASTTTLAAYSPSALEIALRNPVGSPVILAEGNPKKTLVGWTLDGGATYTYLVVFAEARVSIDGVFEAGVALTPAATLAAVETTALSWYFDAAENALYVHTSDGSGPGNFHYEASLWIYLTNYQDGSVIYNGHNYLPFLTAAGVSDISQELTPLRQGNFACSSGSLEFINALQEGGKYFFDELLPGLTWINRKWRLLLGALDFAYADFEPWFTGITERHVITDEKLRIDLVDLREGIHRDLPVNHFWPDSYPGIADADKMREVPGLYGSIVGVAPTKIGTNVYKYHDGRCQGVTAVRINDATKTANVDYFDDPASGILAFVSTLAIAGSDIIEVDFEGKMSGDNVLLTNGALIFKDIVNNFLGLTDAELDLDSIWETKATKTAILMVPLFRTQNSQDVIRTLEHSLGAHTAQDAEGRIGLRVLAAAAPSSAIHVLEHQQWGATKEASREDHTYRQVNVYYSQNPQGQTWSQVTRSSARLGYQYRAAKTLDIYTYLTDAGDAGGVADDFMDMLEVEKIKFQAGPNALTVQAGDLIIYSRARYFSGSGTAIDRTLRVSKITKSVGAQKAQIEAEEIP